MSILDAIDRERWKTGTKDYLKTVDDHNESLDRIAEAAQKPRVMKQWTDDCKPNDTGECYVYTILRGVHRHYIIQRELACGFEGYDKITHWLELEPTPVLPDGKA